MLRIAIDGPGGAGKSSVAKGVAQRYGIDYVDTGAMYRAVALKTARNGIKQDDEAAIAKMLETTSLDFKGANIILDGEDVSEHIRTNEVSMMASNVSKLAPVREFVSNYSRHLAETKDLVMDGRDIGTNVIKDAEVKIYMSASVEVRARRRYRQLLEAGKEADLEKIKVEIEQRDYQDSHRELNPLTQAEDAIYLDTSDMDLQTNIDAVCEIVDSIINK